MSNPITNLIAATGWCVADGATGSNFFGRGLDAGATIIGGCRSTTLEQIAAMVSAHDGTPRRALDTEGMTGALGTPWATLAEPERFASGERRHGPHRRC